MKLSTKSRYALEALLYMALYSDARPMRIAQVAEGTGISEGYLEQIFFRLRKAGMLSSVRGKNGGFLLKDPADITVSDVVRTLEGTLVPVACAEDLSACKSAARSRCIARPFWVDLSRAIDGVFSGITLASLAAAFLQEETP